MDRKTTRRIRIIKGLVLLAFGLLLLRVLQATIFAVTLSPSVEKESKAKRHRVFSTAIVNKQELELVYYPTEEEKFWLEAITFAEAGTTEDFEGQVAIAAEVLNRVQSEDFPNDIISVLMQEGQYYNDFPMWCSPEGYRYVEKTDITPSVSKAVDAALRGDDPTEEEFPDTGAMYHYAPGYMDENDPRFNIYHQMSIGNHSFHADWDGYLE